MAIQIEDLTDDIKRVTNTINGEVWEVSKTEYGFLAGDIACRRIALKGNINTYLGESSKVIQQVTIRNGWNRYWLIDNDPKLRETEIELARLYNHF